MKSKLRLLLTRTRNHQEVNVMYSQKRKSATAQTWIVASMVALLALASFSFIWRYSMWNINGYGNAWQGSLTIDKAAELAEDTLQSLGNGDLAIDEIMEFELNFYIVYYEKSIGIGAFEAIIDKAGTNRMMRMMSYSYVRPEQGPNMMWNTKYGMPHMTFRRNALNNLTITANQAIEYAQKYLDTQFPGTVAEDLHPFYGYYTIHISKDNRVFGMLSVNGYTGQVWYHSWHGNYIQTLELSG